MAKDNVRQIRQLPPQNHCHRCGAYWFKTEDGEHTKEACLENRVDLLEEKVDRLMDKLDD